MTDDIFQRLRLAYRVKDDPVPPGYKSRRQLEAEWKLSMSQAQRIIRTGLEKGILSQIDVRVGSRKVPHYGPPLKKR